MQQRINEQRLRTHEQARRQAAQECRDAYANRNRCRDPYDE
jgi:hypothetical protein